MGEELGEVEVWLCKVGGGGGKMEEVSEGV